MLEHISHQNDVKELCRKIDLVRQLSIANPVSQRSPRVGKRVRRTFNANNVVFIRKRGDIAAGPTSKLTTSQPPIRGIGHKSAHQRPNNMPPRAEPPMRLLD